MTLTRKGLPTMVSWIRRFVSPPIFPDEDRTRIARLLNVMLLAILVSATAFALIMPLVEPDRLYSLALIVGVIFLVLFLWVLMRRGRLRMASLLLVFVMWSIMTASMLTSGGIYSSSAGIYVIFILAAGLLLGGLYGIGVALMSVVGGGVILWAGLQGLIEQRVMLSPVTYWLAQSLTFGMMAVLLYLDTDSLDTTLHRARENERVLVERNRELQTYAARLEQRETTLAALEERYRVVSELISDYAYAVNLDAGGEMTLAWITDAFARISGYEPHELTSMQAWLQIIEPADIPTIEGWIEASQAGNEHTCDYRIVTKSGDRRWLRNYSRPIWDEKRRRAVRIYGAVQDISRRKQAEEEQQRLLHEISRQREELRALNRRLADIQELERKHLVQELHDEVGQNLTAISLNLNIVKGALAPENGQADGNCGAEPIVSRLDDTIALVRQTTRQIRNVMADLRPPVLDDYGLTASLEWYAARISERTGLVVNVSCDKSIPRLAASTENALFRIAQEAITNIVKHAGATCATVVLTAGDNKILLTVGDDGRGIADRRPDPPTEREGWGLLTMQQRAEAIGGQFCIESRDGKGVVVLVEAPI